jgi:hypothetical protein
MRIAATIAGGRLARRTNRRVKGPATANSSNPRDTMNVFRRPK